MLHRYIYQCAGSGGGVFWSDHYSVSPHSCLGSGSGIYYYHVFLCDFWRRLGRWNGGDCKAGAVVCSFSGRYGLCSVSQPWDRWDFFGAHRAALRDRTWSGPAECKWCEQPERYCGPGRPIWKSGCPWSHEGYWLRSVADAGSFVHPDLCPGCFERGVGPEGETGGAA